MLAADGVGVVAAGVRKGCSCRRPRAPDSCWSAGRSFGDGSAGEGVVGGRTSGAAAAFPRFFLQANSAAAKRR